MKGSCFIQDGFFKLRSSTMCSGDRRPSPDRLGCEGRLMIGARQNPPHQLPYSTKPLYNIRKDTLIVQ
jgi:hypothetical protein